MSPPYAGHHALGEVQSQLHANGTALGIDLHWRGQHREWLHLYGDVPLDTRQALSLQLRALSDWLG